MEKIEKSIEVAAPVRAVYNQWTQFEEFPRFMAGVKEVRQLDDTHLHWHAEIWGKDKEWDAEITEQVPDQVIAWRSTSGAPNAGAVRFEPVSHERTRVRLTMEYQPEGAVEKAGDAVGVFSSRVQNSVEDFKKFIEKRGAETGGWRGEVHGGREDAYFTTARTRRIQIASSTEVDEAVRARARRRPGERSRIHRALSRKTDAARHQRGAEEDEHHAHQLQMQDAADRRHR